MSCVLDRIGAERVLPERIRLANGPEFTSTVLDTWAYERKVQLTFIQPGRLMQNGYVESFTGKFRDECLSQNWFVDLEDARTSIEA